MVKWGRTFLISLLIGTLLIGLLFNLLSKGYLLEVPSLEKIENFKLPEASEIYSSDGVVLGKLYLENRKSIPIDDMPDALINCLIANEDSRFYEHRGVDLIGLIRVLFKTLLLSENTGGGSTITQQLVKNRYPRNTFETNWLVFHKMREWVTAIKFEQLYSKKQILEMYLNTVPFGHNSFGIHTAAQYYFNKTPSELKVQEIAMLVGLLKGTTLYDPERNPDGCMERRNLVLSTMQSLGYLSQLQLDQAISSELGCVATNEKSQSVAPFFVQHVTLRVREIIQLINQNRRTPIDPYTDGLKIYTTIDSKIQNHAATALKDHILQLQHQFDDEWSPKRWGNNKNTLIQLLELKRYEGYERVISALQNDSLYSPEIAAMLAVIKKDLTRLHAGFTCIKNTGEVLAWVGGRDFNHSQYDHVKSTRQVGSVFKPIVYVTAVDQGVNLCNYFKNNKQSYSQFDDWEPRNAGNSYHGEYTMKGALTYSLNVISVQVLFRAGLLDVLNVARQMGINTNIPQVPSISLGTPDISLYEMVNAYTCFANDGQRVDTKYLTEIRSASGDRIYKERTKKTKENFNGNNSFCFRTNS